LKSCIAFFREFWWGFDQNTPYLKTWGVSNWVLNSGRGRKLTELSVKISLVNFRKNRKISWLFTDLPFDSSLCGFGKRVD
jgi:hypothetical protein